jgi:hypothetical protein
MQAMANAMLALQSKVVASLYLIHLHFRSHATCISGTQSQIHQLGAKMPCRTSSIAPGEIPRSPKPGTSADATVSIAIRST